MNVLIYQVGVALALALTRSARWEWSMKSQLTPQTTVLVH